MSKNKQRRPQGDPHKLNTDGCIALATQIILSAMEAYKIELRLSLNNFVLTSEAKSIEKFLLSECGQLLSFDMGHQIIAKCRREVFGRDNIVLDGKIRSSIEIGSWRRKRVDQFTLGGKYIRTYESASAAAKATHSQATNICSCCRGYLKSSGGYKWKYSPIAPTAEEMLPRYDK